jgi:signal transduction histidine kinase
VEVAAQGEEVALAVMDTGKGIAPENLARLFERFYRVPDSEGYSEGTGLGLSIARKILEEHGGRIEVESEVGRGTTFRCVLPRVGGGA